jgi:hypothetical protein
MLNVVMLSIDMLNVVMLSVIILSAIMLNVIMLNVIMLNVIMLSVVAPWKQIAEKVLKINRCFNFKSAIGQRTASTPKRTIYLRSFFEN